MGQKFSSSKTSLPGNGAALDSPPSSSTRSKTDKRSGATAKIMEPEATAIPNIMVVTDIGNDYDDFLALMLLGLYHSSRKVNVKLVIVTGDPVEPRCQLARGLLHKCMGLTDIVVVCGTNTVPMVKKQKWQEVALSPPFAAKKHEKSECNSYEDEAKRVLEEIHARKERVRFLSLACLRDTYTIIDQNRALFRKVVDQVHLQSGVKFHTRDELLQGTVENDSKNPQGQTEEIEAFKGYMRSLKKFLAPRNDAKNNQDDLNAARKFFHFIQGAKIPCTVYTKQAAMASKFSNDVFDRKNACKSMEPVADYLATIDGVQKKIFYESTKEPKTRHLEYMLPMWYIQTSTQGAPQDLIQRVAKFEAGEGKWVPFDELRPYVIVTPYDPIAALGCIKDVTGFEISAVLIDKSLKHVRTVGANLEGGAGQALAGYMHDSLIKVLKGPPYTPAT